MAYAIIGGLAAATVLTLTLLPCLLLWLLSVEQAKAIADDEASAEVPRASST